MKEDKENLLRERLAELRLVMRAISYKRRELNEILSLLNSEYEEAWKEANRIERQLVPITRVPTGGTKPKERSVMSTDRAMEILSKLSPQELGALLAEVEKGEI